MLRLPSGFNTKSGSLTFELCKSIVPHSMKTLLLPFLFLIIATCKETTTVYLCDSDGGKKYHLRTSCRGLSNCQHKLISVTLEKAKKQGKALCGWEK